MDRIANVEAVCTLNDQVFACRGRIEILGKDEYAVKARWRMFMVSGGDVALKGISIYDGDQNLTKERIVEKAVASIEKYRINRKRIFSEIKVI